MGIEYTDEIYSALDKGLAASPKENLAYHHLHDLVRAERSKRPFEVEYQPEKSHEEIRDVEVEDGVQEVVNTTQSYVPKDAKNVSEEYIWDYEGRVWYTGTYTYTTEETIYKKVKEEFKITNSLQSLKIVYRDKSKAETDMGSSGIMSRGK